MKNFKLYLAALLAIGFAGFAYADGYDLTTKRIQELPALASASIAAGDLIPLWDVSANQFVAVPADTIPLGGAFNGTLGATTPSTAAVTSLTTTLGAIHTRTPGADSGLTNNGSKVALTAPIDTTGTNTHNAYDVALTISNSSGGTNTVNGLKIENVTGDAQDDVNGINIGTGTTLGTSYAIKVASGWDDGLVLASPALNTYAAGADSGTTNIQENHTFTYPVDTTGTNTHTLINMALTAANATGGTNTVNGLNFANYTGDAQVNVNAINIGTSDALGTAVAVKIGAGWDTGIQTDSNLVVNSTNGTAISAIRFASDTIASGQTAKTVTVTGVTASSKCVAQANEIPSNSAYIKSAAPGTDQVIVTVNTDPGASNLDLTVLCFN